MSTGVTKLLRISRNVADLERSAAFYIERLGFAPLGDAAADEALGALLGAPHGLKRQRLACGAQHIELVETGAAAAPYPSDSASCDLWFQHFAIRCDDIQLAFEALYFAEPGIVLPQAISHNRHGQPAPIALPVASGGDSDGSGIVAFKFRDPDGHPLELIQFGDGAHGGVGIDHSAISVADADRSIAFYTRVLGLRLGHRQTNAGIEQQALDGLSTDTVDVVALLPAREASPHVELLAYRSPRGRIMPAGTTPLDIASDRLVLQVDDMKEIVDALTRHGAALAFDGLPSSLLVRDPDGHFLMLVEEDGRNGLAGV